MVSGIRKSNDLRVFIVRKWFKECYMCFGQSFAQISSEQWEVVMVTGAVDEDVPPSSPLFERSYGLP